MKNDDIKMHVIKVSQPVGDFYVASMKWQDLAAIADYDVRRIEREGDKKREIERYLGIQRPLKEERVKSLRNYVKNIDSTFPTSIIIAVDDKCAYLDQKTMELSLFPYESKDDKNQNIPFERIARVLDGQHRIAAFVDFKNPNQKKLQFEEEKPFDLNVVIFIGADIATQANIFSTVNLAQTKVNKSLAYDLEDLAKSRSPQKTSHTVAVLLDSQKDGPLHKRIKRLGVKTDGRDGPEPLTQAVVVESLMRFISDKPEEDRDLLLRGKRLPEAGIGVIAKRPFRNLFIEGDDEQIAFTLYEYFSVIRDLWTESWNNINSKGNLLPKSNAFMAFMKYLYYIYQETINSESSFRLLKQDDFKQYFDPETFVGKEINVKNFPHGQSGESEFLKLLKEKNPKK